MTTKVYGVFTENKLIFGEDMAYAIYEQWGSADSHMRWLQECHPGIEYKVREVEIACEVANGIYAWSKDK